jgi:hypothetical protein
MSRGFRRQKYRNRRTEVDGINFASQREAVRYCELRLLERAGDIRHLECQVPFNIEVNGKHVCKYIADFVYLDSESNEVVEDAKGFRTDVYRLKKTLMRIVNGIDIKEV